MVRASVVAEKAGIRSASIVQTAFMPQASPVARALGAGHLAVAEYPGVILLDREEEIRGKVAEVVVDRIVDALARPVQVAAVEKDPAPRDIVFAGGLDQVQEHFYQNYWTDGLPIIPPTIERVEAFLRFTDRSPEEVIGALLPARRDATVWNVAVNGVMAGCNPEYMPVLLAIVEAIAEPAFGIEHAGSTPAWEPLVIVSGPIVKELNFNYGTGTMRVGRKANTSIGRFARLCMRNIAGLRATGSESADKGVIGYTFNVALAEDEDAVAGLGWRSFGVEMGFAPGESVVTAQSVVAVSPPLMIDIHMRKAVDMLRALGRAWGEGDVAYWCASGMYFGKWYPLLVLCPAAASALARDGYTKDDIKQYLYENVRISAHEVDNGVVLWETGYDLCRLVAEGKLSEEYCTSPDPNRMVPVFRRPEWIGVVVSGDPGVGRARGYTNNAAQGGRVSKVVKLPAKWNQLLDEARR